MLTDGFRWNCGSQPPFSAAQRLALGAADGTGMSAESQGVTMVTSETRTRKRHLMASSDSMRLSEELQDLDGGWRTVSESCLVSAQSGPTVSGSRANGRHDVRRSSIDQAEGLGHQRRNPECCEGRAGVRARVRLDGPDGRAAKGVSTKFRQ